MKALPLLLLLLLVAVVAEGCGGHSLPSRYLVTAMNPAIIVNHAHKNPVLIEIVDGRGRVLRVVEQTRDSRFGSGDARWSPNGKMVAWLDPSGLNVEKSDGTDRRPLVPATCAPQCLGTSYAWSPNSRSIAVGGAGRESNHLRIVDVATGAATEIAPVYNDTEYRVIAWSPNGRQLAFVRNSGFANARSCCKSWLVVANPDGTAERRLFSFADPNHDTPIASWSPDSRSIAFTDDGKDTHDPHLGIISVSTDRVRRIADFLADDPPVWSPDGRQLAVVRVLAGSPSVSTFNISTGKLTKVGVGILPIGWYANNTITTIGGTSDNTLFAINTTNRTQRKLFALPSPLQFSQVEPER